MNLNLILGLIYSARRPWQGGASITMRVENKAKVKDWVLEGGKGCGAYPWPGGGGHHWLQCPPRAVLGGPLNPCQREFAPQRILAAYRASKTARAWR